MIPPLAVEQLAGGSAWSPDSRRKGCRARAALCCLVVLARNATLIAATTPNPSRHRAAGRASRRPSPSARDRSGWGRGRRLPRPRPPRATRVRDPGRTRSGQARWPRSRHQPPLVTRCMRPPRLPGPPALPGTDTNESPFERGWTSDIEIQTDDGLRADRGHHNILRRSGRASSTMGNRASPPSDSSWPSPSPTSSNASSSPAWRA